MSYVLTGRGFGSVATTIEGQTGSVLSSTAGTLIAVGAAPGPLAPILAVAAGVAEMLAAFGVGSGCGQTCVLSSQYANQASALLDQNIAAYFAITPPRPVAAQQAALANFDTIWNDLEQQCSNPQLGSAGQNCISERESGACQWKATAPAYPGEPAVGACWNWFNAYRDPIANDPDVQTAAETAAASAASLASNSAAGSSTTDSGSSYAPLLLVAAAIALIVGVSLQS